ncbi:sulfatase-like hydrolase/transferase [Cellulophaga sp. L1A9]|uniref:sulfatase-like hydrolase/transferase n=1 Tax=Cellulophaga sp. L1A9 TaxID=2686362 RepID=UPI00131C2B9B|nr:sulfatase-like hydrolase/transferase [Cellulophaga sp. L1A9]
MIKFKLFLALSLFCIVAFAQSEKSQQEKPNILFIFADDQTYNTIGAIESSPVKTPNLDRLAKQGVRFSQTYNMGSFAPAVCVASRAMLITGSFLWKAAAYSGKGSNHSDPNAPRIQQDYTIAEKTPEAYWPEYLKQAGYETYMTGKWHINTDAAKIFDHTTNVRGGMPKQSKQRYERDFEEGKADIWSPYDKNMGGFWEGDKHWSEVLGDDAIDFLHQAKESENPFFMYLAFNAPHDPRQSPKRFVDMYPIDEIEVPENFLPEYPYNEYAGSGRTLRDEKLAPFPRTEYSVKVNRQEYYAIITHMDEQIGRIMDALEATGKADNTYVFFTADHGLAVGEHGFMGKQNMYDCSMRVPLIMKGAGLEPGKIVDAPVYLQDIMATTLDLAEIKKPEQIDFNSLLPLATGETDSSVYNGIYGAYFGSQRMIRTDNYKMIVYPAANKVRLYDIINDPLEQHDLAESEPKPIKLLKELFKQYGQLQKQMDDPVDITDAFNNFISGVPAPSLRNK